MNRALLIGILLVAAATAIAPHAAAGGKCNPGDIDRNCTYQIGDETYDCSVWVWNDCIADLNSQVLQ